MRNEEKQTVERRKVAPPSDGRDYLDVLI